MRTYVKGYYIKTQHRLKSFDYSSKNSYFLTFNTKDNKRILSEIKRSDDGLHTLLTLTPEGEAVDYFIRRIEESYGVELDAYVIMPNHVHMMVTVPYHGASETQADSVIARLVRSTKTLVSKKLGRQIWQDDYYDVIADTEKIYDRCLDYIRDNPGVWLRDNGAEPQIE